MLLNVTEWKGLGLVTRSFGRASACDSSMDNLEELFVDVIDVNHFKRLHIPI